MLRLQNLVYYQLGNEQDFCCTFVDYSVMKNYTYVDYILLSG